MVEVVEDMDEGAYQELEALARAQSTRKDMVGSMDIHPNQLEVVEELGMEAQDLAQVVVEEVGMVQGLDASPEVKVPHNLLH